MKRVGTACLTALLACMMLPGCGASQNKQVDKTEGSSESSFVTVQSSGGGNASSFKDANILEFELNERDDSTEDWIRGNFKVTNTSKEDTLSLEIEVAYKDADGNIVDESHDYSYFGVPAGKSAYLPFDLLLMDGQTQEQIKTIEVTSYEYAMGDFHYSIDVSEKDMESYTRDNGSKKVFKKQNVVTFDYKELGTESDGQHVIEIKAVNNGDAPLIQIEAVIALFDADGNVLGTGFADAEEPIAPGGSVVMTSYTTIPSDMEVASYGVCTYTTKTEEPDEDGFNYYDISLTEEVAEGSTID